MIGILTFHSAHNYGAELQAYALLHFLTKSGYDAEIINYVSDYFEKGYQNGYSWDSIKHILINIKNYKKIQSRKKQISLFQQFQNDQLGLKNKSEIKKANEIRYDVVIFGSDQIWSGRATNNDLTYFGKNIQCKKISYAASLGTGKLDSFQKQNLIDYVSDFDYISIREPELENELSKLLNRKINVVVDPVFLMSAEDWHNFSNNVSINYSNYIFLYQLKGSEYVTKYCKSKSNVINAHPTCNWLSNVKEKVSDVGPLEFVKYIENAECICTDSFHAIAFSCIFHKKVILDNKYATDPRIKTLLELRGVKKKDLDAHLLEANFVSVDNALMDNIVKNSKFYLLNSIKKV